MSQSRTRPLEPHHIRLLRADGAGLRVWLEVPGSLTELKLGRVNREISKLSVMASSSQGASDMMLEPSKPGQGVLWG